MNFRINWDAVRSDYLHPVWILGYAVAGFVIFQVFLSLIPSPLADRQATFLGLSLPYVDAGGMLIADGLKRFSGDPIPSGWTGSQTWLLISVMLTYAVAAPLFVWGLRERTQRKQDPGRRGFPLSVVLSLGLSGPLLLGTLMMSTFGWYLSSSVWGSMKEAQRISSNRDYLINTVSLMAVNAQSFYHVPVKEGGGGGRWANIQGRPSSTIQLEEIVDTVRSLRHVFLPHFSPMEPHKFILEVHSIDSLSIWGLGEKEGNDPLFVNKDGSEGRHQVWASVTPGNYIVRVQN